MIGWRRGDDPDRGGLGAGRSWVSAGVAAGIVAALVVSAGVAFSDPGPTRRRAFAELVGWNMSVRLQPVPATRVVKARLDRSRAKRGTPAGYRGAVVFIEPGSTCNGESRPVTCGAKLEVYRNHADAARRGTLLAAEGERVRVRGAFLLRSTTRMSTPRWAAYSAAFGAALDRLEDLSDIAATGDRA